MAQEAGVDTALIGRERELEELDRFLDDPENVPRALLLAGEPGIAKTSLWRAGLESAHEHGFHVLAANPAEAGSRAIREPFGSIGRTITILRMTTQRLVDFRSWRRRSRIRVAPSLLACCARSVSASRRRRRTAD